MTIRTISRRAGMAAALATCLAAPAANAKHHATMTTVPIFLPVQIGPTVPKDILGGAKNASLSQAAIFAWEEFIALNWPAVPQTGASNTRDVPDTSKHLGDPSYAGPLVWHTYRNKVEIFPGAGMPSGTTVNSSGTPPYHCNYDAAPQYTYAASAHVTPTGPNPPWINADENSQIGLDHIFAGVADGTAMPLNNEILFLAKANRVDFDYVCQKGWWTLTNSSKPIQATMAYINQHHKDPMPGSTTMVSFPYGTIELKSAWRRLGPNEDASRFYTTMVRYYSKNTAAGITHIIPVDETLALVGLHIIQKTPSAPYFIFATFEQADNIVDANGQPAEDVNGKLLKPAAGPLTPAVASVNASASQPQSFKFNEGEFGHAGKQLNYANTPNTGLVTGTIKVNTRIHAIPQAIISVNQLAHQAIAAYVKHYFPSSNGKSPWAYYKLVNVQTKPIDKPTPGQTYTGNDAATYYQANSTIETDYDLQVFSGKFYSYNPELPNGEGGTLSNTITDFTLDGSAFKNVAY
ncbi:MAG TPA: hypothetical protein VMV54_01655, partial [Acidocella sp.]|nr:hypothetical protein [Acidocella sp.]